MIILKAINHENEQQCLQLSVHNDQQEFIPSNLESLTLAKVYEKTYPMGIYCNDIMIGFCMWGKDVVNDRWKIFRFMIDQHFQGEGYGKRALQTVLEHIHAQQVATRLYISYHTSNIHAAHLYMKAGFIKDYDPRKHMTAATYLFN